MRDGQRYGPTKQSTASSRRHLRTTETNVRNTADRRLQPKTRTAFLLDTYSGYALQVMVQLSDPRTGVRGTIIRASIRPGVGLPNAIAAGTPVTIIISHGQVEIIGLSGSL
jgi:hypothetical protein